MAEPAIRQYDPREVPPLDDGTDMRYELIDGVPVAMAPRAEAHRIMISELYDGIAIPTATVGS